MVTCGDLGTEPWELEMNLRRIFKDATTWNAVLLLDEADIFLQMRDYKDVKRNALVSVFLRELEYFDMPQVRRIARDAKKDNYTFASLVLGIVNTDAFRLQGAAGKAPAKLAPVSQVTSQVTAEKLPGASAVKAAEARSGPAAVSSGKN